MRMDLRSLGVTVAMTMLLVLQTTHRVNGEPLNKVWTLDGGTAKDLDPEGITFFHAGSDPKPSENDVHTFSRVLPNDILLSKTVERLAKTKPSLRSSWSHFGGFFPQSESQNDMGMVFSKKSAFKTETLPVFMGNSDTTKKKPTNHVASFAPTNTNDLDVPAPSDFIGENTLQTKLDTPSAADNPFLIFETGNAPVDQGIGLNTLATGSETGGDMPFSSFGSRFNSDFDSSTNTGTDNNAVLSSSPDSNGITFIDNSVGSESSIFGRVSSGNVNSGPFDAFMAGNKNSVDLSSMSDNAKSRESTNTFDFDTNLNSAPTDFTQLGISDVSTGPIYPMDTLGVSPTENKVRIKPLPTFSTDFTVKNSMRPKLTMQVMNNFAAKTTTTPAPPTSQNIKKPTMMITGQFKDQSKGPRFMVKSKFVDLSHIKKEEPTTTTKSTPAEVEPKPTALTPTEITKPSTNSKTPPVTTTINESPSTTLQVDATSDLSQAANSKNPGNKGLKVDFLYPPAPFPSKPETNSDDTSSSINAEQPVNADTKDLIAITGGTKTESVASDVATHLDIPHVRHTNHILGRNTDDRFVTEPDVQVLNKEDVDNSNPGTGAFPNVAPTAEVPGLSTTEFIPLDRIKTNTELNEVLNNFPVNSMDIGRPVLQRNGRLQNINGLNTMNGVNTNRQNNMNNVIVNGLDSNQDQSMRTVGLSDTLNRFNDQQGNRNINANVFGTMQNSPGTSNTIVNNNGQNRPDVNSATNLVNRLNSFNNVNNNQRNGFIGSFNGGEETNINSMQGNGQANTMTGFNRNEQINQDPRTNQMLPNNVPISNQVNNQIDQLQNMQSQVNGMNAPNGPGSNRNNLNQMSNNRGVQGQFNTNRLLNSMQNAQNNNGNTQMNNNAVISNNMQINNPNNIGQQNIPINNPNNIGRQNIAINNPNIGQQNVPINNPNNIGRQNIPINNPNIGQQNVPINNQNNNAQQNVLTSNPGRSSNGQLTINNQDPSRTMNNGFSNLQGKLPNLNQQSVTNGQLVSQIQQNNRNTQVQQTIGQPGMDINTQINTLPRNTVGQGNQQTFNTQQQNTIARGQGLSPTNTFQNQLMNIGQTGGFNQNGPTVNQALPTNNRGNLWNNQQASQASGNAQTFAQQNPNFGNMGTNGSPQNSFANPNINNNQQNGFTNPNLRQFPNIQQQHQQFSLQNQQNLGMLVPGFNQGQMLGLPNDGQFMNFGPNQFGQMRPGPMQDMFGPARPPAGRPMMPFAG